MELAAGSAPILLGEISGELTRGEGQSAASPLPSRVPGPTRSRKNSVKSPAAQDAYCRCSISVHPMGDPSRCRRKSSLLGSAGPFGVPTNCVPTGGPPPVAARNLREARPALGGEASGSCPFRGRVAATGRTCGGNLVVGAKRCKRDLPRVPYGVPPDPRSARMTLLSPAGTCR